MQEVAKIKNYSSFVAWCLLSLTAGSYAILLLSFTFTYLFFIPSILLWYLHNLGPVYTWRTLTGVKLNNN